MKKGKKDICKFADDAFTFIHFRGRKLGSERRPEETQESKMEMDKLGWMDEEEEK